MTTTNIYLDIIVFILTRLSQYAGCLIFSEVNKL